MSSPIERANQNFTYETPQLTQIFCPKFQSLMRGAWQEGNLYRYVPLFN